MKQQIASTLFRALTAVCVLTAGVSAQAATNWTTSYSGCSDNGTVATAGNFGTCGGSTVEVRGSSTTSGSVVNATVKSWAGSGGGLGVQKSGESGTGPHALDNYDGLDALIFKFTKAVSLTSLTLGWNGSDYSPDGSSRYDDSDVSIYAWTGGSATPTGYASSVAGWELIGDYFNVGLKSGNTQAVATPVFSSYWLVSAHGVGTPGSSDAFKVLALAGNYCDKTVVGAACVTPPGNGVPEPGSLALMAMGAFGLMAARRRQKYQAV